MQGALPSHAPSARLTAFRDTRPQAPRCLHRKPTCFIRCCAAASRPLRLAGSGLVSSRCDSNASAVLVPQLPTRLAQPVPTHYSVHHSQSCYQQQQQQQQRLRRGAATTTCASRSRRGASVADPRDGPRQSAAAPQSKTPQAPTSSQARNKSHKQVPRAEEDEDEDEEEDGFLDLAGDNDDDDDEVAGVEDEEYEDEEDEDGEGGEGADDDYAASCLEPDDAPREVVTGGTSWGETVLRAAREVLTQPPLQGLELYLFRALPGVRKVDIRLDRLDDMYGSPSLEDIERFQRGLFAALDRKLGVEAAGEISFEVSSPGAERLVRVPEELSRFAQLPLKVEYRAPSTTAAGATTTSTSGSSSSSPPGSPPDVLSSVLVLAGLDEAAGSSEWRLAAVRANAPVKGRAMSKRQLAQRVVIPLADIVRARIHVDF